jgi:hypothetical protein
VRRRGALFNQRERKKRQGTRSAGLGEGDVIFNATENNVCCDRK